MPHLSEDATTLDVESQGSDGKQKADPQSSDAKQSQLKVQLVPVKEAQEWVRGDPGPYGLLCFGMTTCMLMFIKTRWAESLFLPTVICYALFYGGLGQFVAGVLELIKGNTFGGTAFASYGSFWMGWALLEYLHHTNTSLYPHAQVGKTLWCGLWAVLTAGFFVVTMRKNGCLMTIFSSLTVTFSLLAGGEWNERSEHAAGYIGFFCGASAIYAAFAFLYKVELGMTLPGVRKVAFI
ncbi:hypothetical protein VaNZ11_002483 [Volvox africanus]|uniref:Uncharacterized protein n=1 Tax=Volvox africanus TaxID=51714 RepID=A0ABQ5RSE0_9CHLO|nr:hypothetical protein VaNZ11_002483 [Volvox africanus]